MIKANSCFTIKPTSNSQKYYLCYTKLDVKKETLFSIIKFRFLQCCLLQCCQAEKIHCFFNLGLQKIAKRHFDNNNFCFAHCSYSSCVLIRQYHLKWKKITLSIITWGQFDWEVERLKARRSNQEIKTFSKKNEVIKCIWKNVRELEKPLGGHYLRFFL